MITVTKDMEVGIAKIDEQHKELINRINTITSMGSKCFSKEETQKTLDLLGKYVVQHFGDEEALQIECNYPKYECHKAIHQAFIDDFIKLKEEFVKHGASFNFTIELNNRIVSWIVRHIKNVDVEFGKYYALNYLCGM
jgi:hemerythrin